jgi:hypothetical protein
MNEFTTADGIMRPIVRALDDLRPEIQGEPKTRITIK